MNKQQPNFEILKTAFYQAFIDGQQAADAILMETVRLLNFNSTFKKAAQFKKDFNEWLGRLDIRQSGELINILHEQKKSVPKWMVNKQYCIDYNEHGFLDLIRIEND